MKTVIVLSDTHGNRGVIEKLYPLFVENDYIIHLGDGNRDMYEVYRAFPNKTFVCQGNCDFPTSFSRDEREIEIENCKLFCTHGHRYRVKYTLDELKRAAVGRSCNIALYGHTHSAFIKQDGELTVMNPGSAQLYSTSLSYGYLVINGNKVTATIVPVIP